MVRYEESSWTDVWECDRTIWQFIRIFLFISGAIVWLKKIMMSRFLCPVAPLFNNFSEYKWNIILSRSQFYKRKNKLFFDETTKVFFACRFRLIWPTFFQSAAQREPAACSPAESGAPKQAVYLCSMRWKWLQLWRCCWFFPLRSWSENQTNNREYYKKPEKATV